MRLHHGCTVALSPGRLRFYLTVLPSGAEHNSRDRRQRAADTGSRPNLIIEGDQTNRCANTKGNVIPPRETDHLRE